MRDAAAQFIEDMYNDREPYSMTFLGKPGTGKSFLARLVTQFFNSYIRDKHEDTYLSGSGEKWLCKGGFVSWGAAMRDMLNTGDWARLGAFRGDYFLVLDDILAESTKLREISASKLFEIFEERQGRRWTITTANGNLGFIEQALDARIASRIIRDGNVYITLPDSTPDYATIIK